MDKSKATPIHLLGIQSLIHLYITELKGLYAH